ncbi:uncharacterized protein LOC135942900 [Cloeon dipterum]|uniref:uncharacterized protein LOC135942900 n=1 Tax=Cloeon dipterum TaxID=197152 RepID=UPI00321F8B68
MNLSSLIIGTLLFGVSAAFTRVYEWNEKQFSKEVPSKVVIYGDRIFFGFPNNSSSGTKARLTFAWMPGGDKSNLSPSLHPLQEQFGENCDAVQSVIDLETDVLGRLWVLDGGSRNCQPTFRIFDLKNNDSLLLVHPLAGSPRNIVAIADGVADKVALVSQWNGKYFSFALNENKTMPSTPKTGNSYQDWDFKDLAWVLFSPLKYATAYMCSYQCREIFLADDSTTPTTVTQIGALSSDSKGMLMDSKGVLYFVQEKEKRVTAWDSKSPFKEELLHKFESDVDSINFALDRADNLWLLSHDASSRFFLLKGEYKHKQQINRSMAILQEFMAAFDKILGFNTGFRF